MTQEEHTLEEEREPGEGGEPEVEPEARKPSPKGDVEVGMLQTGDEFKMDGKDYRVGRVTEDSVEALEMTEAEVVASRTRTGKVIKNKTIRYAVARVDLPPDTRVNRL